jgi:hypothetical protein
LEDLRDLEDAINENAGKPLIPWEEAKKDLDIEYKKRRAGRTASRSTN